MTILDGPDAPADNLALFRLMQNKPTEVFEWFREKTWWEGIEVARIVRVFYMLVNKNRGVGQT